jgi:hypothetical protein
VAAVLLALSFAGSATAAPVLAAAEPPAGLARRVLADPRYQRTQAAERPPDDDRRGARQDPGPRPTAAAPSPVLPAPASLGRARLLLGVLVAAAVLLAIVAILFRQGSAAAAPEPPAPPGPEVEPSPEPIADADALAAAGRYGEAVHALLLAAVRHLERRLRPPPPPSRTGRELVALLPLPADSRPAFAELVRQSERWTFGGAEIAREDFERSAGHFRRLTGRGA